MVRGSDAINLFVASNQDNPMYSWKWGWRIHMHIVADDNVLFIN